VSTGIGLGDDDDPEDELELAFGHDILVVDDNQTNLVAIEAALQPLGRPLVLAKSGIEALARLLESDFALIILDVAMPGMDGFETARLVRARARNRGTPIIFITGMSWHDDAILRGYELGALDFLIKPIRAEVLRAKATVFLQLQDRTRELKAKAEELREAQTRAHERELTAQRRRFEAEVLEHQMKQLAETDRRKDEFLAILAHELRNPLQPLQTATEMIDHDPERPVPAKVRGIIQRQLHHLTRLVDDLLDVSRFTAGKLELRRAPVTLESVVDEALTTCRTMIDNRNHVLDLEAPPSKAVVFGDSVRLVQVVVNLLSNASKYTPPKGRITVSWGELGDQGFIRITDNGRGIPPSLLPKIFDMFVQERATADGAGGLGLGLGLVKRLVELHGGTVHASSAGLNEGSAFELRLPVATPAEAATPERNGRPVAAMRPLRAVVVDDAPDLRDLVADLLRSRGHQVHTVDDGPTAIEVICNERPDVALIDIGLPDMDGYEVARRIRKTLPPDKLRLIAMTGYGQASDRASAFDAGFDAHIVKPASADKILRALYGTEEP